MSMATAAAEVLRKLGEAERDLYEMSEPDDRHAAYLRMLEALENIRDLARAMLGAGRGGNS